MNGTGSVAPGHIWALGASISGTFSMVMARYIGRYETNALVQVFYPNLAIFVTMSMAMPFVWKSLPMADLALVVAYAGFLFAVRWVLVVALRMLVAYAVTPLMTLQFVWMAFIGAFAFGEVPGLNTLVGVVIVIASGMLLVWDQFAPEYQKIKLPKLLDRFETDP